MCSVSHTAPIPLLHMRVLHVDHVVPQTLEPVILNPGSYISKGYTI